MKPNWNKLDKARLAAAQEQYDSQVIYPDDIPSVETSDRCDTNFPDPWGIFVAEHGRCVR